MTFGVDARVLVHRPTGVARYLRGLLDAWPHARRPGERLELFVDRRPPAGGPPLPGRPDAVRVARWPLPGGDPAWRQLRLPLAVARARPSVLFCPFYSVPLACRVPRVVTIHDVSFAAHPEWFSRRARAAFALAGPSARAARRVLTVSAFSAGEIVRRLGVPAGRIQVVPPGIDAGWRRPVAEEERSAARRWLGHAGPYVLHLGAVHARRCPELLVEAFARVASRRDDLALVIAGPDLDASRPARVAASLGIGERLIRREWVPEEHLRGLISGAECLAYLSLYEGFGLPALEALAAGAPVVALARASLPEVLGDAAVWVDDATPGAVARAFDDVLADEPSREDRVRAGRARAALFDPAAAAHATFDVLREAAAG